MLKIDKYCYLLHLVGLDFIILPTLKMDFQTQIKLNHLLSRYFYVKSSTKLHQSFPWPRHDFVRGKLGRAPLIPIGTN
jgi:hypothetical protein